MTILVHYSNYINHHQLPVSLEWAKLTDNNFYFVSQKAISEKRISFGYKNISNDYDFVVKTYESEEELKKAYELANKADIVLFGSSNADYIEKRIKDNKLTFKESERLFKRKLDNPIKLLKAFRRVYINHGRFRKNNLYMMCSGMPAAYDFNRFGAYKNKTYKGGYFPEIITYDEKELFNNKKHEKISLVWAGRLIDWKHPEYVIELAKHLMNDGYDFEISLIGNGAMEEELKQKIKDENLSDFVTMTGSMPPSEVRKYMEKANIFLFTSNMQEGWGVVLSEAMNSGCACVADHMIGSAGFLINHQVNGLFYKDGDFNDFYNKVKMLFDNQDLIEEYGKNAYKTIINTWNAKVYAKRLLVLAECLKNGKDTPFEDGPCSKAYPIKDEDLYEYLTNKK